LYLCSDSSSDTSFLMTALTKRPVEALKETERKVLSCVCLRGTTSYEPSYTLPAVGHGPSKSTTFYARSCATFDGINIF
jgi:hypothetical protein